MDYPFVSRVEWHATEPLYKNYLKLPVKYVFTELTRKDPCHSYENCIGELQYLQKYNMKLQNNPDIRYNFLIGGDGSVYEGRGWEIVPRLPFKYQTMKSHSMYIAFMGRPKGKNVKGMVIVNLMDVEYRGDWEAQEPKYEVPLSKPVSFVFCGVRSFSKTCTTTASCRKMCKDMQERDFAAGLPDIRHNFLIGGDNKVYEGRGWSAVPSLPYRYNSLAANSIYLTFIGPIMPGGDHPSEQMKFARNKLIDFGLEEKFIKPKFLFFLIYKI